MSVQRYQEAYDALGRLFDPADPAFNLVERFHGLMFHTEAALHIGRVDEARAVVAQMEQVGTESASPTLHLHLAYCRAVLADGPAAEALFQKLLDHDLIRWPWHRARAELAYGKWLRRQRRSAEARSPLRSALSTLELIGATSWAEQARNELRAAGERPLEMSGKPARRRCRPRRCRSRGWSLRACPTARSDRSCSCRHARSAPTCTASSRSSTSRRAASSPRSSPISIDSTDPIRRSSHSTEARRRR